MDLRRQEHRKMRWVGRVFVVFALISSWGAQAAVESVPPISGNWYATWRPPWCPLGYSSFEALVQGTLSCLRNLPGYESSTLASAILDSPTRMFGRITGELTYNIDEWGMLAARGYPPRQTWYGFYGEVKCPVPTVNPTVPYTYNAARNMCERDPTLTITLTGGTEVEPSNGSTINTLPFIATVKDQNNQPPASPVTVKISLKVDDPKSGGHDHGDSTRPRGGVGNVGTCPSDDTCWSWTSPANNGVVVFNFNPTETSGKYVISATCDGCGNTEIAKVSVKVAGLKPIPPSGLYALYETDGSVIGAVKDRHESNHYLTPTAANKLLVIATNYHHFYPKDPVLHINDASLIWGGVFDVDADWDIPHEEHRRGTVVDIRANSNTGAIPPANFDAFIQLTQDRGIDAKIHNPGETSQHFHVRLLNRSE